MPVSSSFAEVSTPEEPFIKEEQQVSVRQEQITVQTQPLAEHESVTELKEEIKEEKTVSLKIGSKKDKVITFKKRKVPDSTQLRERADD